MYEVIEVLENDPRISRFKMVKTELLNDFLFVNKLNKLKQMDIYTNEYRKMKLELFEYPLFLEFKQLENEINLLILEINNKLKELTNERSCV